MTVKEIAEKLGLTPVSVADDAREVQGGYAGDLLSWVMGRVPEGAAWVTIMTNVNVVAVVYGLRRAVAASRMNDEKVLL